MTVLAALRDAPGNNEGGNRGEAYGYELLQLLSRTDLLATTPATLYPVLARLADEKKISVREAPSPAGPARRYYRLTAAGLRQLNEMTLYWEQLSSAVHTLLSANGTSHTKESPDDTR